MIYLDHAATTPLAPEVREEMLPFLGERFGNPSTIYPLGAEAAYAVEKARRRVRKALNAPEEGWRVVLTGSATEAINLAHKGVFWAARGTGKHLISCVTEHSASLKSLEWLAESAGAEITWVPVGPSGRVDVCDVEQVIRPGTILISIMAANSETGALHPVEEIARLARTRGIPYHCDAVQAVGKERLDLTALGVDLVTINAHKFHGPKGVGALLVREGIALEPLLHGGGQEGGLRAGTENVAGIVGLGKAIELAESLRESERPRLLALKQRFVSGMQSAMKGVHVHGDQDHCLASTVNLGIVGIEGARLVALAGEEGLCIAAGSACTAQGTARSHVLTAMGLPEEQIVGAIRISLGRYTTEEEIDAALKILPKLVTQLRSN